MAARKKANKKSSKTVAKKAKAPAAATARKRKAAAPAARPSRSVSKSKAARTVKAKAAKPASARRPETPAKKTKAPKSATTKLRTTPLARRAAPTTAAKPERSVDTKLQASENQARETVKAQTSKIASASEPKAAPPAPPPVAAKVAAPQLAKRAPVVAKPTKPAVPESVAVREDDGAAAPKVAKPATPRHGFKLSEFVVYPAHGVGQIVAVEDQEVAGFRLELFVINFAKDKMTLRVPTSKVVGVGMRKLSEPDAARRSLDILTGRARVKRTMWSRRAQEYEAKINSGDINAIAEVVRDLYRSEAQPEQSYSERQLYEAALDRMMREIAAVQKLTDSEALKVIEGQLKKAQRRGVKGEAAEGEDGAIEEAA